MGRGLSVAGVLLLAACAGVEGDIRRAGMREFFVGLLRGKDRGAGYYVARIEKYTTEVQRGRYQYVVPAHISHYLVQRSVRRLGGTKIENSDYLALVVDRLMFVMAHDPTGALRAEAAAQLGRVLLRLPLTDEVKQPKDIRADQRINVIAQDLLRFYRDLNDGKEVTDDQIVERMDALADEVAPNFLAARQVLRSLAAPPVAGSASTKVRAASERLTPILARDGILVALRELLCGDELREIPADSSPLVREAAGEVLARVRSPVALALVAQRLSDPVDPAERNADVRRVLVGYLGELGGPVAFEACVTRLDDVDPSVRFHAQQALQRMTHARVRPHSDAWRAWRAKRPAWQVPKKPAGDEKE